MGKSTQPLLKRCKALGINPVVMGYTKESKRNQKEVRRAKKSEYGLQLTEKQKLGSLSRSLCTSVPLPAPDGPEITSSIPFLVSFIPAQAPFGG